MNANKKEYTCKRPMLAVLLIALLALSAAMILQTDRAFAGTTINPSLAQAPGGSAEVARDTNWRYIEFRTYDGATTNKAAIAVRWTTNPGSTAYRTWITSPRSITYSVTPTSNSGKVEIVSAANQTTNTKRFNQIYGTPDDETDYGAVTIPITVKVPKGWSYTGSDVSRPGAPKTADAYSQMSETSVAYDTSKWHVPKWQIRASDVKSSGEEPDNVSNDSIGGGTASGGGTVQKTIWLHLFLGNLGLQTQYADYAVNGNHYYFLDKTTATNRAYTTMKWAENTATLSYNNGGRGTAPASATMKYSAATNAAAAMSATGYTFKGWKRSDNSSVIAAGAQVKAANVNPSNLTLTGQWEINSYTLTANANGGSIPATTGWTGTGSSATRSVNYNVAYGTLPTPTRTGHTFDGWYTAETGGTKVTAATLMGTSAATIYAHWTINKYTVTLTKGTGVASVSGAGTYEYGATVTLGAALSPGYGWKNWTQTSGGAQVSATKGYSFTMGASNLSYTANAQPEIYTISLNNQSATSAGSAAVYEKYDTGIYKEAACSTSMTTTANPITCPKKTGYTFGGYYTATGGSGTQMISATGYRTSSLKVDSYTANTTLYAKWTENTASLTYHANGHGTAPSAVTMKYTAATNAASAITATGYTFKEWNTKSDGSGTRYAAGAQVKAANADPSATTLYAIWTENTASLTYHANGHGTAPSAVTMKYSTATVAANAITASGYTFQSWNTKADGSGTTYNAQAQVKAANVNPAAMTLYAIWKANTYSIAYAGMDGASYGTNHPTSATYDKAFTVNNPTKTGYSFSGWKITNMDSVTHTYGSSTTTATSISSTKETSFRNLRASAGTVTFTAQWTAGTNTLSFDGNKPAKAPGSVTGVPAAKTMTYDSTSGNTAALPKASGYAFKGWYDAKTGGNQVYDASGKCTANGGYFSEAGSGGKWKGTANRTLYAQWIPYKLTLKYHVNKGKVQDSSGVHQSGTTYFRVSGNMVQRSSDQSSWENVTNAVTQETEYLDLWNVSSFGVVRAGYHVTGTKAYNTEPDGSGVDISQQNSATDTTNAVTIARLLKNANGYLTADTEDILYVNWQPNSYTVKFDKNGGTGSMSDISLVYDKAGQSLPAGTFTRKGYAFNGWNTKADGTGTRYADKSSVGEGNNLTETNNGTVTLYAQWQANPYKVRFNANGGEGNMTDQELVYGTAAKLRKNAYARSGWRFKGWTLSKMEEGDAPDFADGAEVLNLTDEKNKVITLYALWESVDAFGFKATTVSGIRFDEFNAENGSAEYRAQIKSGENFYLPGLDVGAKYTVTEEGNRSYKPSYSFSEGKEYVLRTRGAEDTGKDLSTAKEALNHNTTADYVNEKTAPKGTDIAVTKEVLGDLATEEDQNRSFTFWYELKGLEAGKEYVIDMEEAGGEDVALTADAAGNAEGRILMSSSQRAVFKDLPAGATYRFEEVLSEGTQTPSFTPSFEVSMGEDTTNTDSGYGAAVTSHGRGIQTALETVKQGHDVQIDFKNSRFKYHDIKLSKKALIDDSLQTELETDFAVTLEFRGLEHNKTYLYTGGSFSSDYSGKAVVPVKIRSDRQIVFKDIPGTAGFDFKEAPSDFIPSVTITDEEGKDLMGEIVSLYENGIDISVDEIHSDVMIDLQNTRNTRNKLSVTKKFEGPMASGQDKASFVLDLKGLEVSESYQTLRQYAGGPGTAGVKEAFAVASPNGFAYELLAPCADAVAEIWTETEKIGDAPVEDGKVFISGAMAQQLLGEEGESGESAGYVSYHTQEKADKGSLRSNAKGMCSEEFTLRPHETLTVLGLPEMAVYSITEKGMENTESSYEAAGAATLGLKRSYDSAEKGKDLSTPQESMQLDRSYTFTNIRELPEPEKTVSDADGITLFGAGEERNVTENTVGDGLSGVWEYTISQEVPTAVSSFAMTDELPPFVEITLADEEGKTGREPAQFTWTDPDGNVFGGSAQRSDGAGEDDTEYVVKDKGRTIFTIDAEEDTVQDSFSVKLVDPQLLARGGAFRAVMQASLADGTEEAELAEAGLTTPYGYAVTNTAYSLIGGVRYDTEPVVTNLLVPRGLTIRKNVPLPGDRTEPFEFTVRLSGLIPGKQYSYGEPSVITAKLSLTEEGLKITAADTSGKTVRNVFAHIHDDEEELIGNIISGKTDTIALANGKYLAELEYDGATVPISFSIEEGEDGKIVLDGDTEANLPAVASEFVFYADDEGKAEIGFDLKHARQMVFYGLTNRCRYEIEEEASKYVASYQVVSGKSTVREEKRSAKNESHRKELSTGENIFYKSSPAVFLFTNEIPEQTVKFSKTAVNGTQELEGARLMVVRGEYHPMTGAHADEILEDIRDYEGYIPQWSWISDGKSLHEIALARNQVYTMIEIAAPYPYDKAEDIVFRVTTAGTVEVRDEDGNWNYARRETVQMKDAFSAPIRIRKIEPSTLRYVDGAELTLYGPDGSIVDKWQTKDTDHEVTIEQPGSYRLSETKLPKTPQYCIQAEDIDFEVTEEGYLLSDTEGAVRGNVIIMYDEYDPPVWISKYDINGTDEITGARLTVTQVSNEEDLAGSTVDSWESGSQEDLAEGGKHKLELIAGRVYRLTERIAPKYYDLAEAIDFRVTADGKVQILQPDGSFADTDSFEIRMLDAPSKAKVHFSKQDINGTDELPGAHLTIMRGEDTTVRVPGGDLKGHMISLTEKDENTYTLKVTKPDGTPAGDTIFTMQDGEKLTLASGTLDMAKSSYSDYAGKETLITTAGISEDTRLPLGVSSARSMGDGYSWTSGSTPKELTLEEGYVYTMVETQAPEDPEPYRISESIVFFINDDGKVELRGEDGQFTEQRENLVTMKDEPDRKFDIYLNKKVTGNLGDRTKQFEFTVEFTDLVPNKTFDRLADRSTADNLVKITAGEDGKATVDLKLRGGEEVVFGGIDPHAHYKVTEKPSDHVASYAIASKGEPDAASGEPVIARAGDTNGNLANKALTTQVEETDRWDGDVYITFSNNRDMATVTGTSDTMNIWAMAFLILLGLCFFARRMGRKSKKTFS